jgi:diguanylate cyclase (GGDEF)-like protein
LAAIPATGVVHDGPPERTDAPPASVVHSDQLAIVLAEFAETLVKGFRIQGILDHLVRRIVDVLPVTGAGVMLMGASDDLHFVAASNETILAIETLQNELAEGPCLEAYRLGEAVSVPDLELDERFPRFSRRARDAGLAAVFTLPMSISGHRFGALDLYRDLSGDLDASAMEAAQVLANVAAAYLYYARDRAEAADTLDLMRQRSLHDPLTGLPNRTLLRERLEQAVARNTRTQQMVAVLFVDLDRFKTVNDRYGHHVGDRVLVAVADRMKSILRPGDTVARLSGDEFVVICDGLQRADQAERVADKIAAALAEVFVVEGEPLQLTASIGLAFCGPGASMPDTLLREADSAMYQAKEAGGARRQIVDHEARIAANRRGGFTRNLRDALANGQFQLAYQPIVRIQGGALEGVEALLRWHDPTRGWVAPNEIVPVAELTGLVLPIGEWALTQACRDFQHWQERYGRVVPHVTVNVSPVQVIAAGFELTIKRVLDATGMDPANLFLEVTESVFLEDGPRALAVLEAINSLGVGLILDDFGTGYSSLNYLRRFPFDVLKIDAVFTANVATDPQTRTIVAAVIDLAHGLGLTVVAEAVETDAQLAVLSRLGADRAQGYHLSRPMLIDQFEQSILKPATALPIHLPLQHDPLTRDAVTSQRSS